MGITSFKLSEKMLSSVSPTVCKDVQCRYECWTRRGFQHGFQLSLVE